MSHTRYSIELICERVVKQTNHRIYREILFIYSVRASISRHFGIRLCQLLNGNLVPLSFYICMIVWFICENSWNIVCVTICLFLLSVSMSKSNAIDAYEIYREITCFFLHFFVRIFFGLHPLSRFQFNVYCTVSQSTINGNWIAFAIRQLLLNTILPVFFCYIPARKRAIAKPSFDLVKEVESIIWTLIK